MVKELITSYWTIIIAYEKIKIGFYFDPCVCKLFFIFSYSFEEEKGSMWAAFSSADTKNQLSTNLFYLNFSEDERFIITIKRPLEMFFQQAELIHF